MKALLGALIGGLVGVAIAIPALFVFYLVGSFIMWEWQPIVLSGYAFFLRLCILFAAVCGALIGADQ